MDGKWRRVHVARIHATMRHGEKLKLHYELYTSASYIRLNIVAPKEMVFRRAQRRARDMNKK